MARDVKSAAVDKREAEVQKLRRRFSRVFGGADGRAVLDEILKRAGVGRRIAAVDARAQEQAVGRHDLGVEILELVEG